MQSEGSYCFKNCSHVSRMEGKHVASANLSPCLPGGCVAETHFLCHWEEGGFLFFHWLCRESLQNLTPAACVEAKETASWSL